jgi:hypothetical protein
MNFSQPPPLVHDSLVPTNACHDSLQPGERDAALSRIFHAARRFRHLACIFRCGSVSIVFPISGACQQEGEVTVFLNSVRPNAEAEELYDERQFLIKGPEEDGRVIYYLTRALQRFAVPAPEDDNGTQTVAEYFDALPAGSLYLAAQLGINGVRDLAAPPQAQTEV